MYTALKRGPVQCNVEAARTFMMLMRLLIYLPSPYPLRLARLLRIYYTHTIAELSVLVPSQPTYLVSLSTAYMYMYGLFKLI